MIWNAVGTDSRGTVLGHEQIISSALSVSQDKYNVHCIHRADQSKHAARMSEFSQKVTFLCRYDVCIGLLCGVFLPYILQSSPKICSNTGSNLLTLAYCFSLRAVKKYEDIYFVYRIFFSRKGTSNDFIHTKNKRFSNYFDVGHALRLYIIPIEGGWNVFSYASTSWFHQSEPKWLKVRINNFCIRS